VQNRLAQVRAKFANLAKLGGKFSRVLPGHVAINDAALLFREVVFQRPTEAAALDHLAIIRRHLHR
jgi:hypothetical protein